MHGTDCSRSLPYTEFLPLLLDWDHWDDEQQVIPICKATKLYLVVLFFQPMEHVLISITVFLAVIQKALQIFTAFKV